MPQLLLKLLPYLKAYWKELAIICLAMAFLGKMRYDHRLLIKTYEEQTIALQEQIDGLNLIHAEELRKKEAALQAYKDSLEELEKDYNREKRNNRKTIDRRRDQIEEQFSQNKEELANEIINNFNFEYVPM
jgi:hypothetical protein